MFLILTLACAQMNCGAGTHAEGATCVADPADTDSASGDTDTRDTDTGGDTSTGERVVDVEVCAGGAYPSLQAGIDAAADGDIVGLCPGDYTESVLIDGKALTVVGLGPLPDDVTWRTGVPPMALVTGGGSLALEWVALAGDESDQPDIYGEDAGSLAANSVHFVGGQTSIVAHAFGAAAAEVRVEQSLVDAPLGLYLAAIERGSVVARQNVVTASLAVATSSSMEGAGPVELMVQNNVVVGGELFAWADGSGSTGYAVRYNTVVRGTATFGQATGNAGITAPDCPDAWIEDNIFYESETGGALWYAYWQVEEPLAVANFEEALPRSVLGNVIWALAREQLATVTYFSLYDYDHYRETWQLTDTGSSADWLGGATLEDPAFIHGEAGSWVPDPAGPAAGAGAFAGAGGDWWRAFPWPMP